MTLDPLDYLEKRHEDEEATDASSSLLDHPRIGKVQTPTHGLSESEAWLERLYASERMPRDKKPFVLDPLRSYGAWMASIDQPPLCLLDGMSQTATLPFGFGDTRLLQAYLDGVFGDTILSAEDISVMPHPAARSFASTLQSLLPGFRTVCFVNSGAEANEKALGLCWAHRTHPTQRRVLAFEGAFHGRTLLALHATANPSKRGPYELAGYEAQFAPFPVCNPHHASTIRASASWLADLYHHGVAHLAHAVDRSKDTQLATDIDALQTLETLLKAGECFACILEPMQSEGGDRYASTRFFQAVRVLTRKYHVPLIMDEVQTGFGLGGSFCWHQQFTFMQYDGTPDLPDCVTFAKRAQVGVVLAHVEDSEPSTSHGASLVRGRLHAELLAKDTYVKPLQAHVSARLETLHTQFPSLMLHPRVTGYALAFDLPTPKHLEQYLAQRMSHGVMVFGAGDRTVRYRLSTAFADTELNTLFNAIEASLRLLDHSSGNPAALATHLKHHSLRTHTPSAQPVTIRLAESTEADTLLDAIMNLEARMYEPARRDSRAMLAHAFEHPDGVVVVAEQHAPSGRTLVGVCLGVPLEVVAHIDGPNHDPMLGQHNTLYIQTLAVDPRYHGRGLGRELKLCILHQSKALVTAAGVPRYLFQTGRNRIGHTQAVSQLNQSLGAYEVQRFQGQYGDPDAQASYYRIHLRGFGLSPSSSPTSDQARDLCSGISRPLLTPPATLSQALRNGSLCHPALNKLTLSNYVTPAVIRAVEWVSALCPELPHLFLTSSRDECVDKTLRCMRFHRPKAHIALGLQGGYVGHTTAAARSLSDAAVHRGGPAYFEAWPLLPHPQTSGIEHTLAHLEACVAHAGGGQHVFGLFLEAVQERTGRVMDDSTWQALHQHCQRLNVPLVLVETASSLYRSGRGPFYSSTWSLKPDAMLWWAGGQLGFIHLAPRYRISTPLTMISTWDGDELSLIRVHHQLRTLRHMDTTTRIATMDELLKNTLSSPFKLRGTGMYRMIEATNEANALCEYLQAQGWQARCFANQYVPVAPSMDISEATLLALEKTLSHYSPCES